MDIFFKESIFDPLQMNSTGFFTGPPTLEDEAKGYAKTGNEYKGAINCDKSWTGGAMGMYSTVEDLYKWNEAIFNGKVLNEKSMKDVFTAPTKLIIGSTKYGCGWNIDEYRSEQMVSHNGGISGFTSHLLRFPEENLTIAVLANGGNRITDFNPSVIAQVLAETYLWEKMDKQPCYSFKSWAMLDGVYDLGNSSYIIISHKGKNLFWQLSSDRRYMLFLSGSDEFTNRNKDIRIKFVKNEKGDVSHIRFFQGGNEINANKLINITLDSATIKNYLGKYDFGENHIISIVTETGKLFMQLENKYRIEIVPLSKRDFRINKANGPVITFCLDQEGKSISILSNSIEGKKEIRKIE